GERDADVPRGVVDQDVHATKAGGVRSDGGFDRDGVALVELDGQASLPGRPDRVDRRGGALLVADVGDGDVGAGLRQGSGDRATDVTGAPGDEGGFTFEIHAA